MKKSFKISNDYKIRRKYQLYNHSPTDWHENGTAFISHKVLTI